MRYWSKLFYVWGSGVVRLERRVIETVYQLLLSKAKVLPARSSSGSGVVAPAENFLRRWRPMGSVGGGGSAVAGSRRWGASVPRQRLRRLLEEFTPFLRGGARVART